MTLLARRQQTEMSIPGVDRQREYHILRKLNGSRLAPEAYGYADGWLLLAWRPGRSLSENELDGSLEQITSLVGRLHQQPLSGYRLSLLQLLEQYWQLSQPRHKHCRWLRALRRLQQRGEPKPLRTALLHMDIHPGNLIVCQGRLTPIDWEYASDGDVALELAAIIASNALSEQQQARLIAGYAAQQKLNEIALRRQICRWQPWLRLLMASWYELRWQQSGEAIFSTLAAQAWQRVLTE